jgi:hypothetical protein
MVGDLITTEDGSNIQLDSTCVVCMGAPRVGLLNTLRYAWEGMAKDTTNDRSTVTYSEALLELRIYVVDIGINEVWRAYGEQLGLATWAGLDFGFKWAVALRLAQEVDDEDDEDDGDREYDA